MLLASELAREESSRERKTRVIPAVTAARVVVRGVAARILVGLVVNILMPAANPMVV